MDLVGETIRAEKRIRPHIRETFLERSPFLSEACGANVYLKLENLQHTGSFKARGALSKILSLTETERARGIVAASTGNHGAAVAYALSVIGGFGVVFVTEGAPATKIEAIRRWGAGVRTHGADCAETEAHARKTAEEDELVYVSPYNDPLVIAGQGTIGIELAGRLDRIDAVFVPLGGGGLVSGIAGYLKSAKPGVEVIGCSPENSQVMIQSVKAGRILDMPSLPTLSDGTAGGIEAGSMTFELCRDLVDDYITVTEDEIREGLRLMIRTHRYVVEGAAAVAPAACLKAPKRFAGGNVVVVISGANIDPRLLKEIL
jgi:threonine dehydratase